MNNDIAVEILRELWRYKTTDKYTEIEIRRALETAIEAVNGLRPHGEWIPCSERLPKEQHQLYLVTKKTSGGFLFATRSYFFSKTVGWSDDGVVAWMPLPEPYKEEGESE